MIAPDAGASQPSPPAEVPVEGRPADPQFMTDHLLRDLKRRSVRGAAVTVGAQGVRFALQMGSTAVLARLLLPADFGLLAMVNAVIVFVAMFKDAGLSAATVQRAEITHEQVSTLFWLNVAVSTVLTVVVAALSPVIAWFYSEPKLALITVAVGGTFLFGGLTVQHQALMRRQMRFRDLAVIDVVSMAAGVGTAIIMAWVGCGYWSLVGMTAATSLANCVLVWVVAPWRPGLPSRRCGVWEMVCFGGNLTAFSFVNQFSRNMDNVLIGWRWGPDALGFYAKAYALLLLPIKQINAPISAVVLPALSRLQNEPARFRRYYCRAISLVAVVGMPVAAFSFVAADPLIRLVLGPKWVASIPIFQALAPAALAGTMNIANGWVFISLGRADRQLRWGLAMAILTVTAFAIALPWGAFGVALAYSTVFVVTRYPGLVYCFRGTPLRPRDVWLATWRPVAGALAAAGIVWLLALSTPGVQHPLLRLLMLGCAYGAAYPVALLLTPGGKRLLLDLLALTTELRRRRAPAAA